MLSFAMIDRFGRKPLYIVGSLGMGASLLGAGRSDSDAAHSTAFSF